MTQPSAVDASPADARLSTPPIPTSIVTAATPAALVDDNGQIVARSQAFTTRFGAVDNICDFIVEGLASINEQIRAVQHQPHLEAHVHATVTTGTAHAPVTFAISHQAGGALLQEAAATPAAPTGGIGMIIATPDGTLLSCNDAALRILGMEREQLQGRTPLDPHGRCVHPDGSDYPGPDQPIIRVANTWTPILGDRMGVYNSRSGQVAWITVDVVPVSSEQGRRRHIVTTFTEDNSAEHTAMASVRYQITHDQLTGLRNHNQLLEETSVRLHINRDADKTLGVICIDIDRFGQINTVYGRAGGDSVLREVASRLLGMCAVSDTVIRSGGDEFVMLVGDIDSRGGIEAMSRQVQQACCSSFVMLDADAIAVGVSIGCVHDRGGLTAQELLQAATEAQLRSRHNRVHITHLNTDTFLSQVGSVPASVIADALAKGNIRAWYQPVVDLQTGQTVGYEALARLINDTGEVVAAEKWFPTAANYGLVDDIDKVTTSQVITTLTELPAPMWIAKNISAGALRDSQFATHILTALEQADVDPSRLHLEITESMALVPTANVTANLQALNGSGVGLWLDDFGAGYSSLQSLLRLPFTGVKLDRSFVASDRDPGIIKGMSELIGCMNLRGVAEGIETEAQHRRLHQSGWQLGQGWLFGKAAPAPALL